MNPKFRYGDRVRLVGTNEEGEVTVVRANEVKVMFDNSYYDYCYYDNDLLELVEREDV
jgi:hypothetical protein